MGKSIRTPAKRKPFKKYDKPDKPYDDYPLFAHVNGRWAKKIHGKFAYFGSWKNGTWQAALDLYLKQKDDLYAGRDVRREAEAEADGYTVGRMCDEFMIAKREKMDRGALNARHFRGLYDACKRIDGFFGSGRLAEDVAPGDFERLAYAFPKTWGLRRRKREIGSIRAVFAYACLQERIARTRFGGFKSPSKDEVEAEKFAKERKHGNREFTPEQLRTVLDAASAPMKAAILLGVNCGYGNTDISELPLDYLDLDGGWATFPRIKTSVPRRAKLWDETVAALREAIAARPRPIHTNDDGLVFITAFGNRFVRCAVVEGKVLTDDSLARGFRDLLIRLGIKRPGLSFYSLRHCCESRGGSDQIAIDRVMGHRSSGMGSNYRQSFDDARLVAVAASLHAWLFGG